MEFLDYGYKVGADEVLTKLEEEKGIVLTVSNRTLMLFVRPLKAGVAGSCITLFFSIKSLTT